MSNVWMTTLVTSQPQISKAATPESFLLLIETELTVQNMESLMVMAVEKFGANQYACCHSHFSFACQQCLLVLFVLGLHILSSYKHEQPE